MTDFARPDQTSPLDGQPSLLDGQHSTAVAETAGNRQPVVDQHRYTGPELSALLNQVRLELGAEANIVEANRVRSGGVAGFFAKESYEVVVAAPAGAATTRRAVPTPADAATTRRAAPAPTTAPTPARRPRNEVPHRSPSSPAEISIALLERAEAISAIERASVQRDPDDGYDLRDRGPAHFAAVLDAELASEPGTAPSAERLPVVRPPAVRPPPEHPSAECLPVVRPPAVRPPPEHPSAPSAERPPAEREVGPAAPTPVREAPPSSLASVDAGQSNVDRAIELDVEIDGDSSDYAPLGLQWAPDPEPSPPASPLRRADSAETDRDLTSEMQGGRSLTIVGSIEAAMAMARRIVSDPLTDYADFVVVTPDPAALDLPASRAGRHYEAVTRHLFDWAVRGRNGIVVVDVALGSRLRAEVLCVRHLGVDSVYVVDDQLAPAATTLEQLDGIDGTVVIEAATDRSWATDAGR